ncbi:substrate-binding domain-containing protein [Phormidium sp. LEGE 05292]|uniref:substrate-binding domain-containing protein n=1 Tax=[Phormidium] sp. LEGE 05292 TaxID=767427 RepID=UPI001882196A|nr:substrate-binding domain-containing protein [Phormidium sp. LEGE 05292]MBE9225443.1 substrate-binding domain-containing protein [Phormidium sp. LEGE 05292]
MKLTDLINSVGIRVREVTTFIRYPVENASRMAMRRFQNIYENIEIGQNKRGQDKDKDISVPTINARQVESSVTVIEPKETANAMKIAIAERLAKRQPYRGDIVPILPKNQEIRGGRRGRYRIDDLVKDSERVRLYNGVQVVNNKPVIIKEYLLSDREFNKKEAKERKEKFDRLARINLKNGGGQDFRLISPWDAVASTNERSCYLILDRTINNSTILREYLANNGPMSGKQVRQVLYQILQTLWFLHSQRLRFSADEIQQGLPHGNLSLDSLLIVTNNQNTIDEPQFFIYVSDLALWEDLFKPPNTKIPTHSPEKDLQDLGYVCFYLLSGGTVDRIFGQPLDPTIEQHWLPIKDAPLKKFIHRLLGIDKRFASAYDARQALLELPLKEQIEEQTSVVLIENSDKEEHENWRVVKTLLMALVLAILAGVLGRIIWLTLRNADEIPLPIIGSPSHPCCFAKVDKVPSGETKYVTEADGTWDYILNNSSLSSYTKTLVEEIKNREARLQNYTLNNSSGDLIEEVRSGKADFALTTYVDNLPSDLQQQVVAYDGLVVFVAFSNNKRKENIPNALDGRITLDQLRELYTKGEISNWSLPEGFNNIKLYLPPDNPLAIQLFEKLVFKDKPPQELEQLKQKNKKEELENKQRLLAEKRVEIDKKRYAIGYRKWSQAISDLTKKINDRKNDETYTLEQILNDFENKKTVGIGFGLLSRIFGQCSVYPLAVGEKNQEIQPLVRQMQNDVKPIEPTTDLCNDKGSYWPNVKAFESGSYPLMYKLVVVYPKNKNRSQAGKKFAELLKTEEGQRLLLEAGLVPLESYLIDKR